MENISEKEKALVKKDAKLMMDSFFEKLKKLDSLVLKDSQERSFEREEGEFKCPEDFRDKMFSNAKNKDKNFILSEKGNW